MRVPILLFALGAFVALAWLPVMSFAQLPDSPSQAPVAYRIQPGDKLAIRFFANQEFDEPSVVVRPDGYISPQLVPEVRAAGHTVAELKAELEKAYDEILLTPMITVSVLEFVAPRVFIGGQVFKPGPYELRQAKTVVQSIFLAGGFTDNARRTLVIHARPDGKGDWKIQTIDVMKVIEGKGSVKDTPLEDGDYVFVPNSRIYEIGKAIDAFKVFVPRIF